MPTFTVPDSFGITESNSCHTSAGSPAGGEFCSAPGTSAPSGVMRPIRWAHDGGLFKGLVEGRSAGETEGILSGIRDIRERSGHDGPRKRTVESIVVLEAGSGVRVGHVEAGAYSYIEIKQVRAQWVATPGQLLLMHTHPSGSTFSFEDLRTHNEISLDAYKAKLTPWRTPRVASMIVAGYEGSWYEMTFERPFTYPELAAIEKAYNTHRDAAERGAEAKTTAHLQTLLRSSVQDRDRLSVLAAAQGIPTDDIHATNYRDESPAIWEKTFADPTVKAAAGRLGPAVSYQYHLSTGRSGGRPSLRRRVTSTARRAAARVAPWLPAAQFHPQRA